MISSSTLALAPKIDFKHTRPLPLGEVASLDLGKSKQQQLPNSFAEQGSQQQALNQHVDQIIEQQVSQISDRETTKPSQPHQHRPLAVAHAEPLLELIDLDQTLNPSTTRPHQHKPLALGQNTSIAHPNGSALHQHKPLDLSQNVANSASEYKPLALNKTSGWDIQLLTEQSSAMLKEPAEQFERILQTLLQNTSQENPLYWLENNTSAATQVAAKDAPAPDLAWQESLWF